MRASKIALAVILIIAVALPASAQTVINADNFKSKLKESYELYCQKKYNEAITLLELLVAYDPKSEIRYSDKMVLQSTGLLAWVYYDNKEWEKALVNIRKAERYTRENDPDADLVTPIIIRQCYDQMATEEMILFKQRAGKDHPLYYTNIIWPEDITSKKRVPKEDIPQQERDRTAYWFHRIFKPGIVSFDPDLMKSITYSADMTNGDDWATLNFRSNLFGNNWQVVDGRSMTVLVHPGRKVQCKLDNSDIFTLVMSCYKTLFRYNYSGANKLLPEVRATIPDLKNDEKGVYGSVICVPQNREWLRNGAVKWWSNGKLVVFHINKIIDPPVSKGQAATLIKDACMYIGGISNEDARPFKRFGKDVNELYMQDEFRKAFVDVYNANSGNILQSKKLPDKLTHLTDLGKLIVDESLSRLQRTSMLISWFRQENENPAPPHKGGSGKNISSDYIQKQILLVLADEGEPIEIDRTVREDILDDYVKDGLCITLGLMGDERQTNKLQDILRKHKDPYIRSLAARALGDLGVVEAKPALKAALNDGFSVVGGNCVGGIRTIYPVREEAMGAIRRLALPERVKTARERNKAFADEINVSNNLNPPPTT